MQSLFSPTGINIYAWGLESFLTNIYTMNNFSKPWMVYKILLAYILLLSEAIETNPGPSKVFKHITSISETTIKEKNSYISMRRAF